MTLTEATRALGWSHPGLFGNTDHVRAPRGDGASSHMLLEAYLDAFKFEGETSLSRRKTTRGYRVC